MAVKVTGTPCQVAFGPAKRAGVAVRLITGGMSTPATLAMVTVLPLGGGVFRELTPRLSTAVAVGVTNRVPAVAAAT